MGKAAAFPVPVSPVPCGLHGSLIVVGCHQSGVTWNPEENKIDRAEVNRAE